MVANYQEDPSTAQPQPETFSSAPSTTAVSSADTSSAQAKVPSAVSSAAADAKAMPPPPPTRVVPPTTIVKRNVTIASKPLQKPLATTRQAPAAQYPSTAVKRPVTVGAPLKTQPPTTTIVRRPITTTAPVGTPPATAVRQVQIRAPVTTQPPRVASSTPTYQTQQIRAEAPPSSSPDPPPSPPPGAHTSMPEQIPSGTMSSGSSYNAGSKKRPCPLLRRGKWTTEEEAYATKLIHEFKAGLLPLTDGTTLRNFLSKLLNCDPMRISKKFVGNNCIGKQVFRRRGADICRLTGEEMRRTAMELSELEQRFFDRVATTNRVKPPGCAPNPSPGMVYRKNYIEDDIDRPPTPPWLRPPAKYVSSRKIPVHTAQARQYVAPRPTKKPKIAVPMAAPTLVGVAPPRPVGVPQPLVEVAKLDTEKVMESLQRSNSGLGQIKTAASQIENIPRSESALEQLARTASAAKFVEDIVNGDSGLGDIQIKGAKFSSLSLQGSFQALMSLDLDSVENLVQLTQSSSNLSSEELNKFAEAHKKGLGTKSSSRMESFIKSLSNANLKSDSGAALSSLFQNIQNSMNENNLSSTSIFDEERLLSRIESATGLTKLRAHNGLNEHHNSVEDFLSLMTSGDIPHEDANMLNTPLQKVMEGTSSASKLSQHQLLKLASRASLAKLAGSASLSESLSDLAAACTSTSGTRRSQRKKNA